MKNNKNSLFLLTTLLIFALLTGCAAVNSVENEPTTSTGMDSNQSTESAESTGNGEGQPEMSETDSEMDDTSTAIETESGQESSPERQNDTMKLQIGERIFTATLVENSSTEALKELLAEGPISIEMQDYGNMEKVGSLGTSLPTNDEQITTEPGDLILYQGEALVIYYAPNSWNFTRLGKINDVTQEQLKEALGSGNVTVTLSLDWN